jgi:hypothetical protein
MKTKIILLLVCSIAFMFSPGCEFDNYDAPDVTLTGRIVYQGNALNLASKEVTMQIWEEGWQLDIPIVVNVNQLGEYSAMLYKGSYKMVVPGGQGPFIMTSDTLRFELSGDKSQDVEVMPYYLVSNASISAAGGSISANFGAQKVITGANEKAIQTAYLYVNKTQFVDKSNTVATASIAGGSIADPNSIALNVAIPTLVPTQNYVFARVGIKISGVEDMIFSEVVKLTI